MSEEQPSLSSVLTSGIFKENPVFVMFLGMCPVLGVTTSLENAIGMGAGVLGVLFMSNLIISIIRKAVPDQVRIPVYIVIIASLTTVLIMILQAFVNDLYNSLGVFLPLIAVNCIVLGRAEAFASKNNPGRSMFDAIGVGIGFLLALCFIGGVRELLGTGGLMGLQIFPSNFAIPLFTSPPGSFLTVGFLVGIVFSIQASNQKKRDLAAKELAAQKKAEV